MKDYTMDQYTLQSYFKSLCNSFYIAYNQIKRLEEKEQEVEDLYPQDELETVNMLLKNYQKLENAKDLVHVCSKEELEQKKERLEILKSKYEQDCEELECSSKFWSGRMWNESAYHIEHLMEAIKRRQYTIVVTSKEEVVALMAFFRNNSVEIYRIINVEEEYLEYFPTDNMSKEFLKAYISCDQEEMEEVRQKYF